MHRGARGADRGHGCAVCDRWFDESRRDREPSSCAMSVSLTNVRCLVGRLGAAPGTPPEPGIFMRWASHLRRSTDPRVRDTPILLRPHPSRMTDGPALTGAPLATS